MATGTKLEGADLRYNKASASSSSNHPNRNARSEYDTEQQWIDSEVEKVLDRLQSKYFPNGEISSKDPRSVKAQLHAYFHSSFDNMVQRYLSQVESELRKRAAEQKSQTENAVTPAYTEKEISEVLSLFGRKGESPISENTQRRRAARSVQWAFWSGACLVLGMIIGSWLGGIWIGAAFIPGLIGAYGLFVSSGKLLSEIDARSHLAGFQS